MNVYCNNIIDYMSVNKLVKINKNEENIYYISALYDSKD